jgi:integrase
LTGNRQRYDGEIGNPVVDGNDSMNRAGFKLWRPGEMGLHVHAHKLWHTPVTWLTASGATALEIQEQLGHGSMEISLRYVHLNDGNRKTTIDRYSPV